ncbi:MAG TPA: ankyrin repeat domain-containing protein, partial [Micromonosporaceae bacterium]
ARELLRAARSADDAAIGRIRTVSESAASGDVQLADAQLAVAREYGYPSWTRLKAEVDRRLATLAEQVDAFCVASIRGYDDRVLRLLEANPEIATYNFATAILLGDDERVRRELEREPAAATRPDPRSGWTPLHAVCASRWHRLDPGRAPGLLAVARRLLDAGADPNGGASGGNSGWTPLRCAVAGAANPAITRLLLDRSAIPTDHDVYLACFGGDGLASLRLVLEHAPFLATSTALAAPISTGDIEAVRLLLAAGVDPRVPTPAELYGEGYEDEQAWPTVYAAIRSECSPVLIRLLLDHGADPNESGPDGRSPYRLADADGRDDVTALLLAYGGRDDSTPVDRFLAACRRADRAAATRLLAEHPRLVDELGRDDRAAIVTAARHGESDAVRLMLDLGLPVDARDFENGATALHAAAYAGSAKTVRALLDGGADVAATDMHWGSPALEWAMVGSGERPTTSDRPDWIAVVRLLLAAGADTSGITLSPDDDKPPSAGVAEFLRNHGVGNRSGGTGNGS